MINDKFENFKYKEKELKEEIKNLEYKIEEIKEDLKEDEENKDLLKELKYKKLEIKEIKEDLKELNEKKVDFEDTINKIFDLDLDCYINDDNEIIITDFIIDN